MIDTGLVDKKRLYRQKFRIREILRLQNRISEINCQLNGPSGMKITDMPKSQNPFDKLSLLVQEKMEKEKKINKIFPLFKSENTLIINKIGKLAEVPQSERGPLNSVYQDILRYFYLEDKNWDDILGILKKEFKSDDEDAQLRLLHKWHGKALKLLERI